MMIEAFIFDLDGVITDTAEYHYLAWKRLADEEGIPFSRQDNEALRGVPRAESLRRMLKGKPIAEDVAQVWMDKKNGYYQSYIQAMSPDDILPGAMDLLIEIRAAGFNIALASASKNAVAVVERLGLNENIDTLCDGYSVSKHKPAPDLFLLAAKRLGAVPHNCIVLEDAEAGIQAGIAAGMHTIGLGPVNRVGSADLVLPNLVGISLQLILERFQGGSPGKI
jgi:beta-phosphoglucomutase